VPYINKHLAMLRKIEMIAVRSANETTPFFEFLTPPQGEFKTRKMGWSHSRCGQDPLSRPQKLLDPTAGRGT